MVDHGRTVHDLASSASTLDGASGSTVPQGGRILTLPGRSEGMRVPLLRRRLPAPPARPLPRTRPRSSTARSASPTASSRSARTSSRTRCCELGVGRATASASSARTRTSSSRASTAPARSARSSCRSTTASSPADHEYILNHAGVTVALVDHEYAAGRRRDPPAAARRSRHWIVAQAPTARPRRAGRDWDDLDRARPRPTPPPPVARGRERRRLDQLHLRARPRGRRA